MVTVGVGMRLTYCQRSWGCLLAAAVGVGDVVLEMLVVASEDVGCSVSSESWIMDNRVDVGLDMPAVSVWSRGGLL